MISLRPHQQKLYEEIKTAVKNGYKRIIAVASTGYGKTRLACAITESSVKKGNSVLILTNREKLMRQWGEVMDGFGFEFGIIQFGYPKTNHKIQIASVDSYISRLDQYGQFDIVFSDECQYSLGDNFRGCIEHHPKALSIGLSATPSKTNGEGFFQLYDIIIQGEPTDYLIKEGWLSSMDIYSPNPPDVDLELIDGDFNQSKYMKKVSGTKRIKNAIELYNKHIPRKLTIVFAINIQDARNITKQFNDAGISAKCVHSKQTLETQEKIIKGFKDREYLILVSVTMLVEGFDCQWIEAAIDMSPTASVVRFIQRWGRVIRAFYKDGMPLDTQEQRKAAMEAGTKPKAVMLDLAGNYWLHSAPWIKREWTLLGSKPTKNTLEESITSACICQNCGRNYSSTQDFCPYCHASKQQRKRVTKEADGTLVLVTEEEATRLERESVAEQERKQQAEADRIKCAAEYNRRKKAAKTLSDYMKIEYDLGLKKGWGIVNYNIRKKYVDRHKYRW